MGIVLIGHGTLVANDSSLSYCRNILNFKSSAESIRKKSKADMGFVQLLEVASMPVIQVLLVSALGAFMATQYFNNLLSPDFRKSLNKVTDSSSIK